MKNLVQLTQDGEYKPICANCIKKYHCSGQSECLSIMMQRVYELENYDPNDIHVGEIIRVKSWNQLRDCCWVDADDKLEFFDGNIFYEEDSDICGHKFKVLKVTEDSLYIMDDDEYERCLSKNWVWKVI